MSLYLSKALKEADARRLAEVHRLSCAGLDSASIAKALSGDFQSIAVEQVESDLVAIAAIKVGYGDTEEIRASIALDIDRLFHQILEELGQQGPGSVKPNSRALYFKEAREALRQKADLFGLNSMGVNIGAQGKLAVLLGELRDSASELEAEENRISVVGVQPLSLADAPADGLLVESDPGDGGRARGQDLDW